MFVVVVVDVVTVVVAFSCFLRLLLQNWSGRRRGVTGAGQRIRG